MSLLTEDAVDVHALYSKLQGIINGAFAFISTDKGEWEALNDAATNQPDIVAFAKACTGLWTNKLDQYSWSCVKNAATIAQEQEPLQALETMMRLGFLEVENPSHNAGAWKTLNAFASTTLAEIYDSEFQSLMLLVIQINAGVTTDNDEWQAYANICKETIKPGNDYKTYLTGCEALWTSGLDQGSWACVKNAAAGVPQGASEEDALAYVSAGYLYVSQPSHNAAQWGQLQQYAETLFVDGKDIPFNGTDTRSRRTLHQPDTLPEPMDSSFLLRKNGFPAHYTTFAGQKVCHVEYFMRLDVQSASGAAYFIVTHSQDHGGYVGLAKVDGASVGAGKADERITTHEPDVAGDVVWWDLLNGDHPGGCNHPGNGGQIGTTVVLVGQDWTKTYPFHGHVVDPVGHGSKVLFYDFAGLETDTLPSSTAGTTPTNAYLGALSTEQLGLRPGDDGEISSVVIEQGPDGLFYLIGGNRNQTVCWVSAELVPDITKWRQVAVANRALNDGSAMLSWATFGDETLLYYVTSGTNGMNLSPVNYLLAEGQVIGINVVGAGTQHTKQDDRFGDGDWVADNGSLYAGASGGVALYGAYKSIDDKKGPNKDKCVQVRAWYQDGV